MKHSYLDLYLPRDYVKNIGRLPKPITYKRRTNLKLQQWILSYLGIEETKNPYRNLRANITPLQISKLVPASILRSSDDILNTMYNMQDKGLLEVVEVKVSTGGFLQFENGMPRFQITVDGIIQFRKYIRPIVRLVINHEEQYLTVIDKTEGDAQVKAELKRVSGKIKDKAEDKAIDIFLDSIKTYGYQAAIFITKLVSESWKTAS